MFDRISRQFYLAGVLILLLSIQNTQGFMFTGYEIIDLNFTTNAAFTVDSYAWSATRLYAGTKVSSMCYDTYVLGGFQVLGTAGQGQKTDYFQRVYTNLPKHNAIRFTITVWAIDSWDPYTSDGFNMYFDSTYLDGLHVPFTYHTEALCGIFANDWKELRNIRFMGTVPHSATSLTFKFNAAFDEDSQNESVGFRDVNFAFVQTNTTVKPTSCGIAATAMPTGQCSCPDGQYLNGTVCKPCDKSCTQCFGPGNDQCYACKKPGYGWDGFKCVACGTGCFTCNGNDPTTCLPCNGNFYYPEAGICMDDCDYPLSPNTTQYGKTCSFSCADGQYLMPDQTCSNFCPSPSKMVLVNNYYKLCTL